MCIKSLRMRVVHIFLALILLASPAFCNQESDTNVNSRYTVESVELSQRAESRLSRTLKADLQKLVGDKFNPETVDRLVQRIKKELSGYKVVQRIAKGTKPENIKVVFDVVRNRHAQDLVLPRLAYHSRQNFTFGADADFGSEEHKAFAGILTDNNELLERYSGFRGGYQRVAVDGRFRAGFIAESYRSQWNPAIETALAHQLADDPESVPGIYRNRFHIRPKVEVEVLPGVSIGAGISLQRFQTQFPAARYESSNAVVTSLRLLRNWDFSSSGHHKLEAGYDLRAATRSLGSDFAYARHSVKAQYSVRVHKEYVSAAFTAGLMNGRAPLFDRFVLGNANTLRGYNKYDVAPLGGNRMAHGSIDYRHSWFRVVYDTGTVYSRGRNPKVLHSLAAGLTSGHKRDSFSFLVAFPLREGRAEPLFIVGMNF
jgi:hypothetical protein